jgi:hypothetical protein
VAEKSFMRQSTQPLTFVFTGEAQLAFYVSYVFIGRLCNLAANEISCDAAKKKGPG